MYIQSTDRVQKEEATKARVNLKAIESLTYTCTDPQLLRKLNIQLQSIMNEFRSNLPENEGLVILPAVHERAKRALRNKKSQKHLSLPLYKKRGRKRLDSMYRNRVGRKANALRKVNCLPITHIVLLNYLYLRTNWTTMHTMNFLGSKGAPC